MSKYEAQRAMKLAKYERDMARAADRAAGSPRAASAAAPAPAAAPSKAKAAAPAAAAASSSVATCGHKSMNGRMCTREAGHSEKSHRYS